MKKRERKRKVIIEKAPFLIHKEVFMSTNEKQTKEKEATGRTTPVEYFSLGMEDIENESPKRYAPEPTKMKYQVGDIVMTPSGRGRIVRTPTEYGQVYSVYLSGKDDILIVEEKDIKKKVAGSFEEDVKRLHQITDSSLSDEERVKQTMNKLKEEKAEQGVFIEPDEYSVKEVLKQGFEKKEKLTEIDLKDFVFTEDEKQIVVSESDVLGETQYITVGSAYKKGYDPVWLYIRFHSDISADIFEDVLQVVSKTFGYDSITEVSGEKTIWINFMTDVTTSRIDAIVELIQPIIRKQSVKEVLKQTMQSALENKEGGRPHDLGYSGDAWIKVWIDETDLEFDTKIEEIKKMSISLDEKIELAKRRAYELALEQVNDAEGIKIEVKALELTTDRIDWEEILGPENEKEGSVDYKLRIGDDVKLLKPYTSVGLGVGAKGIIKNISALGGEVYFDVEFEGVTGTIPVTKIDIRRISSVNNISQEDEDHVKLYNVAEEYTDDFGKVSYEKNPGLDEEEILKYYEVAPEEYAGLKVGELKEISPTHDTVYEIKRVANKAQEGRAYEGSKQDIEEEIQMLKWDLLTEKGETTPDEVMIEHLETMIKKLEKEKKRLGEKQALKFTEKESMITKVSKAIARIIPEEPVSGKKSEVAMAYGLTIDELNRAMNNFLQSEGYDGEGNEYNSLHDWLTIPHGEFVDKTPYQKGDEIESSVKMADIYRPDVTKTEWYSKGKEDKSEAPKVLSNYPNKALFDTDIEYQHALESYWKGYGKSLVTSMIIYAVKIGWLRDDWISKTNRILDALSEVSDTFKEERKDNIGPGMNLFNYYSTSRYEELERPLREEAITKSQAKKLLEDLIYQFKIELFAAYGITNTKKVDEIIEEPSKEIPIEPEKDVEKESVSMNDAVMYGEQYPPKGTGAGMPSSSDMSRLDGEIPVREIRQL